jgi:hypothetical protein
MANRFKSDGPTKEIKAGLEKHGASVEYFKARTGRGNGGRPDLLVGAYGTNFLLEVKSDSGELSEEQVLFAANWQGLKPITVRTLEEALIAVGIEPQF